jgi:hypothetical protein
MEMAAQAVMKDGATKVRRYNTFVKHDRRPAKKGSYARRHDDWQREVRPWVFHTTVCTHVNKPTSLRPTTHSAVSTHMPVPV